MWNGKLGVRIAAFKEHQYQVNALTSDPNGDIVCIPNCTTCLIDPL